MGALPGDHAEDGAEGIGSMGGGECSELEDLSVRGLAAIEWATVPAGDTFLIVVRGGGSSSTCGWQDEEGEHGGQE